MYDFITDANTNALQKQNSKASVLDAQLENLMSKVLQEFVDKKTLQMFGYRTLHINDTIERLILECNIKPVAFNGLSPLERFKENIKLLLDNIINDNEVEIKRLLKNEPLNVVLSHILERIQRVNYS